MTTSRLRQHARTQTAIAFRPRWQVSKLARKPQFMLAAALLGLTVYRLILLHANEAPPGADAGNWLSYSRQLFGESGRAARSIYLPNLPLLVRGLSAFLPPLETLKVLGVGTSVFIGVPFWLLIRKACGDLPAILITICFVMSGYQVETLAYGAYPQILGSAWLLFSLYWLWIGFARPGNNTVPLGVSALFSALALGTHISGAFDVMMIVPSFVIAMWLQERGDLRAYARKTLVWAGFAIVFSLPYIPFYLRTMQLLQGNPAGPQGYDLRQLGPALLYVFGEQRILWMAIVSGTIVVITFGFGKRRGDPVWPTVTSLFIGSLALFALTSEIRVFELLEAGVVASLAVHVSELRRWTATLEYRHLSDHVAAAALPVCLVAVMIAVIAFGAKRTDKALGFYQVLDPSALNALNWLKSHRDSNGIIVTSDSATFSSPTYGWWIEGYARWPAYQATDPAWFSFTDEKTQTAVANRLLASTNPEELGQLVTQYRVRYVLMDGRGARWATDIQNLSRAGFETTFVSGSFVILKAGEALVCAQPGTACTNHGS